MEIPKFQSKKDLFDFLIKNESRIIADKKANMKKADAFNFGFFPVDKDGMTEKANKPVNEDVDEITVRAIINTTNLMDTYDDVHIPGLWNKSLKENKDIWHDQEHRHEFASTIAEGKDLTAYTKTYTWKELGQKWEGETQALVFDSTISKDGNNPFMFDQYKKGRVKNHSVGMQYVKIDLAVNDKTEYPNAYKVWEKYIDQIANKERAEELGYFFAVTEAKVIEGSAVKRGANWVTPTEDNNVKSEPAQATPEEPEKSTLEMTSDEIIKRIKSF
jgi:hypothetical protein